MSRFRAPSAKMCHYICTESTSNGSGRLPFIRGNMSQCSPRKYATVTEGTGVTEGTVDAGGAGVTEGAGAAEGARCH